MIRNNTNNTKINRISMTRKQKGKEKLYEYFKGQAGEISHEKTWAWLRKENPWREIESLQIAAKKKTIHTNYVKAKINKTQQNSKCGFYGDSDKTNNHIVTEYCKLAQT